MQRRNVGQGRERHRLHAAGAVVGDPVAVSPIAATAVVGDDLVVAAAVAPAFAPAAATAAAAVWLVGYCRL